jgi:hypothetical protein
MLEIRSNVDPAVISTRECFTTWVANDEIMFRLEEDVLTSGALRKIRTRGQVRGFYSLFPLKQSTYEELLNSTLDYDELADAHIAHIKQADNELDVWLLILDFEMPSTSRSHPNPMYLICDLAKNLRKLLLDHPNIKGVVASI